MADTVLGTAQLSSGANVGFKTGLQTNMDTLLTKGTSANATPGYFYLTSDTHRLYVGNNDKSISPVNEGIVSVATIDNLPAVSAANKAAVAGQFYYITGSNILCVYSGSQWVQINEVIDTFVGLVSDTTSVTDSKATITTTVENHNASGKIADKVKSDSFNVSVKNGLTVTNDSDNKGITIGDGRSLSAAANTTSGADIIYGDGTNNTSVNIVAAADSAGSVNTTVAYNSTNKNITIAAKDTHPTSATFSNDSTSGFKLALKDNYNQTVTSTTLDPSIKIGTTTVQTKKFVNGVADFSSVTYSKADIDSLMQGLNAMHYIGTVGTSGTAGTGIQIDTSTASVTGIYTDADKKTLLTSVAVGDTFLMNDSFTLGGVTYGVGTLLIAQGTEDTSTGYITSSTLKYAVVQESHNTDTNYQLIGSSVTDGYKVALKEQNSNKAEQGNITMKGSTYITVAGAESGTSPNNTETITVTHKDSAYSGTPSTGTAPTQSSGSLSVDVISSITTDSAGHITAAEKKTVTIKDGTMSGNSYATSNDTNKTTGTIKNTVTYKRSDNSTSSKDGSFTIESSTLQVTANSGKTGLVMDMVWGSFD